MRISFSHFGKRRRKNWPRNSSRSNSGLTSSLIGFPAELLICAADRWNIHFAAAERADAGRSQGENPFDQPQQPFNGARTHFHFIAALRAVRRRPETRGGEGRATRVSCGPARPRKSDSPVRPNVGGVFLDGTPDRGLLRRRRRDRPQLSLPLLRGARTLSGVPGRGHSKIGERKVRRPRWSKARRGAARPS